MAGQNSLSSERRTAPTDFTQVDVKIDVRDAGGDEVSPMRWVMLIRQNDQRSSRPIVDLSEFNNNPDVVVVFSPKVWHAKKNFSPSCGGDRH